MKINHKWLKGGLPQECAKCGLLRSRKTFKIRMAIMNHPPWEAFIYETKMVYTTINGTTVNRPNCK
jgi:hypothetical protein